MSEIVWLCDNLAQLTRFAPTKEAKAVVRRESAITQEREAVIQQVKEDNGHTKELVATVIPVGMACLMANLRSRRRKCHGPTFWAGNWSVTSSAVSVPVIEAGRQSTGRVIWFSDRQFNDFPSVTVRFEPGISAILDRSSLASGGR
jgi:hypothetical protein